MLREAWTLAIETLSWMQMQRLSEHLALARTLKQLDIADANAVRKAHSLVYETVRRQNFIDKFINKCLENQQMSEYDLGVQAFLRLYVYQTRITRNWLKVDVAEAEDIAKTARTILGWKTTQLVEPILGKLLTQEPTAVFCDTTDEERISFRTFHPQWFVKYCFKLLGRSQAITMLEANMQTPSTYIRLNTLKDSEKEILSKISGEGVEIEKVAIMKHTYKIIRSKKPIAKTDSYKEGMYYVQDKASCFAAEVANPKQGMTVLDVCAAPGAKTTHLAQLMQNQGRIYSVDYSKRRMKIWQNEVDRMGVEIAEPVIADARNLSPLRAEADLVVLDPPCTGTGAFGRSPSAKWRLALRSIDRMAELQRQFLNECAKIVKTGGILTYSTCSVTAEENEFQIENFLKRYPEFSLAEVVPKIGLEGFRGLDKCQRLYPHLHDCNGFFIAKLQKQEP